MNPIYLINFLFRKPTLKINNVNCLELIKAALDIALMLIKYTQCKLKCKKFSLNLYYSFNISTFFTVELYLKRF
jgi:hypothetical protein